MDQRLTLLDKTTLTHKFSGIKYPPMSQTNIYSENIVGQIKVQLDRSQLRIKSGWIRILLKLSLNKHV